MVKQKTKDKERKVEIRRIKKTRPYFFLVFLIVFIGVALVGSDIENYFDETMTLEKYIINWIFQGIVVIVLVGFLFFKTCKEKTKEVTETVYVKGDLR